MKKIAIVICLIIFVIFFAILTKYKTKSGRNIPILEYHVVRNNIPDDESAYLYVTPETFKEQIGTIKNSGYNFITFEDLKSIDDGEIEMPKNPIIITFDDGYLNNYTNAYPILDELGVNATFFVSTANIREESVPFDENKLYFMSWDQLAEMEKSDTIDIESHGHEHVALPDLTEQEISKNINTSYDLIVEKVGKTPIAFSIPYGMSSQIVDDLILEKHKYIIKVYRDSKLDTNNIFFRHPITNDMTGEDIIDLIQ